MRYVLQNAKISEKEKPRRVFYRAICAGDHQRLLSIGEIEPRSI